MRRRRCGSEQDDTGQGRHQSECGSHGPNLPRSRPTGTNLRSYIGQVTTALLPATSALLARDRRRKQIIQWSLLGGFTVVGLLTLVLPIGKERVELPWLHIPYIFALAVGAGYTSWGTWVRFQMAGTDRDYKIAAAFGVLALLYAPHAFYHATVREPDPANFFYGPASRLAFGLMLIVAMSPLKLPKFVKEERTTLLLNVLAVVAVGFLFFHPDWLEAVLDPKPVVRNQQLEALALVAQSIAIVQFMVKWARTRRRILITWAMGVGAMAISSALMIPTRGWELRWWWAHLALAVATVVFNLGTDKQMARAIDERELRLVYQPKVDLKTGELMGVEALLRWQHPDRGLVPPDDFIPKAEETDLIRPFTEWAIREATKQHRAWLDSGLRIPIAVNITARLLRDVRVIELLRAELEYNKIDATALILELTESASLDKVEGAIDVLHMLANEGFRIAVDDYGTGYSSLSYIRNLPVKELKLDKSFVSAMTTNAHDFQIVKSTLEMAQGLGLKVVAEGVEEVSVAEALAAMGCDIGQGYLWSRPIPADDLAAWARAHVAISYVPAPVPVIPDETPATAEVVVEAPIVAAAPAVPADALPSPAEAAEDASP